MPEDTSNTTPAARWDGRRVGKATRRDAILNSVASVLSSGRLSTLTMQDIADELGITKGNLYYYFTDKQDILYQCHMRAMDASLEALRRARQAKGSPGERLQQLLAAHIVGILKDGLGSVLLTDLENLRPENRDVYVARRDEFERGVRKLIEEGMKAGEFHCDDSLLAGFSMLGAINWITKWFRADGRLSVDDVAAGMSRFLMGALYCPPGMIPALVAAPPEADAPPPAKAKAKAARPAKTAAKAAAKAAPGPRRGEAGRKAAKP
ncbi:TetR/AcrR family transcriptional regulator [Pigmentiphaga kullae]|uniref:TetR family transcriptional regulator n=1 Tax=Pigmentiphaga kullae TaxID=151784 RepID=A0A4Q7ND45_9BURK|nr:TetR/AcrR family transcriptional regulator [Pigmentiphaga kullae]RZS80873.1 TetR family transcriptional regulator [Pigmentiphaga kullae]